VRDTTERARLERAKSEFVATASHELRSPLTSIKGFAELLARAPGDLSARQREFVQIILSSTDRLVELVGRTPTLEIHETPEHLNQLEVLEDESWEFGQVVPALIELFTTGVCVVTTALLLLSVHPLLLLLPLFGLPALLLSSLTAVSVVRANRRATPTQRATGIQAAKGPTRSSEEEGP